MTSIAIQTVDLVLTVFSPAMYYFGYIADKNITGEYRTRQAILGIDKLRSLMPEPRPFVK